MWRVSARTALLLALGACQLPVAPYESAYAPLPLPLEADAFDRVLFAVRQEFPTVTLVDREAFRIQTAWRTANRYRVAAKSRATLWLDETVALRVVVESQFLRPALFGVPQWSSIEGDPALERELIDRVLVAFE